MEETGEHEWTEVDETTTDKYVTSLMEKQWRLKTVTVDIDTETIATQLALDKQIENIVFADIPTDDNKVYDHKYSTREDCQYEVSVLGSRLKAATDVALSALQRGLRYLLGTRNVSVMTNAATLEGWTTSELDMVDVFDKAPEDAKVVIVEPPPEDLERLRAEGKRTDVQWKLHEQVPGR